MLDLIGSEYFYFYASYIFLIGSSASFIYWAIRNFGYTEAAELAAFHLPWMAFFNFYFLPIMNLVEPVWGGIFDPSINKGLTVASTATIITLMAFIFSYVSTYKTAKNALSFYIALNLIGSSIFVISATWSQFSTSRANIDNHIQEPRSKKLKENKTTNPNMYYIIPDGLSSIEVLRNDFSVETNSLVYELQNLGFSVSEQSYSAYNLTFLTLASLFELNYVVTEESDAFENRDGFYPGVRERASPLRTLLMEHNYEFIIVPPRWGGCPRSKDYHCLVPKQSKIASIINSYAVQSSLRYSALPYFLYNLYTKRIPPADTDDTGKTLLHHLTNSPEIWEKGNTFTLVHMMMPHSPYRTENCDVIRANTRRFSKEGYRSSVICTFKRLTQLAKEINKKDPNAMIIIQADHGVQTESSIEALSHLPSNKIHSRLSAFSANRTCNSAAAKDQNNVNLLRHGLSCLLSGVNLQPLKNESYWGYYENSSKFGTVDKVRSNQED